MRPCIYTITCVYDGHVYVGSTGNFSNRRSVHIRDLRLGKHHSKRLQEIFNVRGMDALRFEAVEYVEDANFILAREQFWIWRLNPELNVFRSVVGRSGYRISDATRAKLSAAAAARPVSAACRQAAVLAVKGKVRSVTHRENLSAALKGRTSPTTGKRMSEATRARIGEKTKAAWGRNRERMLDVLALARSRIKRDTSKPPPRGWTHSEETRARMSAARMRYWQDQRSRAGMN